MMQPTMHTTFSARVDPQGHLILPVDLENRLALEPGSVVPLHLWPEGLLIRPSISRLQKVYIEPTSRCNLACRTCMRHAWGEPAGDMAAGTFERIIASLACLHPGPSVFFGGFGEPLLHPDITGMVARAAGISSQLELITNGVLLTPELGAGLVMAGLDTLWVSLDGASPESYSDVRSGSELAAVLQNIVSYREQYRRLRHADADIGVVFVAMKRNIAELPSLIRESIRVGITRYLITNVLPYTPEMCEEVLYRQAVDNWGGQPSPWNPSIHLPKMDVNALTRDALLRIRAIRPGMLAPSHDRCPFMEQRSTSVAWDGSVSPCLALLHSHTSYLSDLQRSVQRYHVGNVNKLPLKEIWLSEEYTHFRQKLEAFDLAPCTMCASCEMAEGNQEDCFGDSFPTCGGCLWARGIIQCP